MRAFEIKVYQEFLTVHIICDRETAREFYDWVEESQIPLWEPGQVDFEGNYRPINLERRIKALKVSDDYQGLYEKDVAIWCLGHHDSAVLLKLRWHDHFSEEA